MIVTLSTMAGCGQGKSAPAPAQGWVNSVYAIEQYELAVQALRAGNETEALAAADRALADDAKAAEAYVLKASLLARKSELAAAMETLEAGIAQRPDFAELFLFRGILREHGGEADVARADYDVAVERYRALALESPERPERQLKLAVASYLRRGPTGGYQVLLPLLEKFPEYTQARFIKERFEAGDRAFAFRWITGQGLLEGPEKKTQEEAQ